jgi:enamine deaminase RidA (YjgF/YER057c/UK114 family)
MKIEARLKELGIELPPVRVPTANFVQYVLADRFLYLAGAVPILNNQIINPGKVGAEVTLEQAYQSARACTINHLAFTKEALGDLDRVERVIRLEGWVNVAPGFKDMPKVINGASDLWIEVFGEAGRHTRTALGCAEITRDIPVETIVTLLVRN